MCATNAAIFTSVAVVSGATLVLGALGVSGVVFLLAAILAMCAIFAPSITGVDGVSGAALVPGSTGVSGAALDLGVMSAAVFLVLLLFRATLGSRVPLLFWVSLVSRGPYCHGLAALAASVMVPAGVS